MGIKDVHIADPIWKVSKGTRELLQGVDSEIAAQLVVTCNMTLLQTGDNDIVLRNYLVNLGRIQALQSIRDIIVEDSEVKV